MKMKLPTKPSIMARDPKDHIMLFYGPPGTGKTSFVNGLAPRVLFLSTDRGTRTYKMMRVECKRWVHFEQAIKLLQKDPSKFDIIAFDHIDDFANMAEDEVCKELGISSLSDAGFGKGWKAYRDKMRNVIRTAINLGIGVVFIAHEELKTITQNGIERTITMPSMSKSAWKVIIPMVDLVGFTSVRRVKVGKGDDAKKQDVYTLQTEPTTDVYAKDRTRRNRPDRNWEQLNGKAFVRTFEHGQEDNQKQGEEEQGRGRRGGKRDE